MNYLILIFFLLVNLPLIGQNDIYTTEATTQKDIVVESKNVEGFDFGFIGLSYHYGWRLKEGKGLFLGGELGCLPDIFYRVVSAGKYFTQEHTIWSNDRSFEEDNSIAQLFFAHLFLRWKPQKKWIEGDVGFRGAYHWRNLKYYDGIASASFIGLYLKPAVGYKRFKVGVRLDTGVMHANNPTDFSSPDNDPGKFNEFVVIASPFIRYNFK